MPTRKFNISSKINYNIHKLLIFQRKIYLQAISSSAEMTKAPHFLDCIFSLIFWTLSCQPMPKEKLTLINSMAMIPLLSHRKYIDLYNAYLLQ